MPADSEDRDALEVSSRVLRHFGVGEELYRVGRTKLFFRAGVLGLLEDVRARILRYFDAPSSDLSTQHAVYCSILN